MLRYKHLKPWLMIYLVATIILFLNAIGITAVIIMNDINGFSFSSVQFLSCPLYISMKVNIYLEVILQVCFILSIGAIVFALGQFVVVIWQFFMLRKEEQEKGEGEENLFEDLSFGKLIMLYILNGLGFLCLIPIAGTFMSLYIEFANCTDPLQNKSSTYFIPTAVAGGALLFQILSLCMLLKLVYHFEHKVTQSQRDAQEQAYGKENKYKYNNENGQSNLRRAQRDKQLQQMQRMRQRIMNARMEMATNKYAYNENNYMSSSTEQENPKQMENGLLKKYSKNSSFSPNGDSIYEDPGTLGYGSKNKIPKEKRKKNGLNKGNNTPNKYAHNPTATRNNPSNPNLPNQLLSPNNPMNQTNPNIPTGPNTSFSNPARIPISNNQINSNSNLSPNNPSNPSKNPTNTSINSQQTPNKDSKTKSSSMNPNGNESRPTNAQQISEKQKELMKTLPKNPYKKNISSKHQPSEIIFEEPGSEEDGSEFLDNLPLNKSNINPTKGDQQKRKNSISAQNTQANKRKGSSSMEPNTNNQQFNQSPNQSSNFSANQSPKLSPDISPIIGPGNTSFDLQDDELNLNDPSPIQESIRVKYLNSPYLKHLKNKNITPEERRNIKRPFLKPAGNVIEFDSHDYEVTDVNLSAPGKIDKKKSKNNKNNKNEPQANSDSMLINLLLPMPVNPNNQQEPSSGPQLSQSQSLDNLEPLKSQRKSRNSNSAVKLIIGGIIDAQQLQQENPIIEYIDEDQDYDDRLQKIINFDQISKKRRRYIYNPFETDNKNNEKLYLHKNKMDKGFLLTQNDQNQGYDAFQDEELDNVNYGKMIIEDDGNGNPVFKIDKGSSKMGQISQSQAKKNKKDTVLLDFIRSKHVID